MVNSQKSSEKSIKKVNIKNVGNEKNDNKKVEKPKPKPKGTNKGNNNGNGGKRGKVIGKGKKQGRLTVDGKDLKQNEVKIFLLGTSFSWLTYGQDFGSGAYANTKPVYEAWLAKLAKNGGNCVRITVHVKGQFSPKMDNTGYATGADTASLINELGQFLTSAEKYNIFVIIILWNGGNGLTSILPLFSDEIALSAYLDKVLTPMVFGLAKYKALAAYEVISKVEKSIAPSIADPNPCFDTNIMINMHGANADRTGLRMKNVLRFINRHASAIHSASPKSLVTLGANAYMVINDVYNNSFNYYKDKCLIAAGGKANGILDFYEVHSFTYQGHYHPTSPMVLNCDAFTWNKPAILGEFSSSCSEKHDSASSFKHIYEGGYCGGLGWQYTDQGFCSDTQDNINSGIIATKDMKGNGKIKIKF